MSSEFDPPIFSTPIQVYDNESTVVTPTSIRMTQNDLKTVGLKQTAILIPDCSNNTKEENNASEYVLANRVKQKQNGKKRKRISLPKPQKSLKKLKTSTALNLKHRKAYSITENIQKWSKSRSWIFSSKRVCDVAKKSLPSYALDRLNKSQLKDNSVSYSENNLSIQQQQHIMEDEVQTIPLCPLIADIRDYPMNKHRYVIINDDIPLDQLISHR